MTTISIKCGNKNFFISEDNLRKSSYFSSVLDRWTSKNDQSEKIISVDQDPRVFRHVLNALRAPVYKIPRKHVETVYGMLDFYGVKYDKLDHTGSQLFLATSKVLVFEERIEYLMADMSKKNIVEHDKSRRKFDFVGKLIDLVPEDVNHISKLTIIFNGKCILIGRFYLLQKGLTKEFKKYLDGLVGEFIVKFEFVRDKMGHVFDGTDDLLTKRYYKKTSWCKILYFELIRD